MSRPSITGCWEKLCGAEEQLDALEAKTKEYVEGKPYVVGQPEDRPNGWKVFRFENVTPPPLRFGVNVGEIVHDMRSALDHLVWQLVRLNRGTPKNERQVQFPICDGHIRPVLLIKNDPTRYWSVDAPKALSGVHPDHVALIQSLQPYQRGSRAHRDSLYVLTALWNADKHRVIHAGALNAPKEFPTNVTVDSGGFSGINGHIQVRPGRLKNGATALGFMLTEAPYGIPRQMYVSGEFPVGIKFGKRRIGTRGLRELGWYVSQHVLECFASDFPRTKSDRTLPRPFHSPPPPREPGGPGFAIGRPEDTNKRFGGWKVWFDPGTWVPYPAGQISLSAPMWHFDPPEGPGAGFGMVALELRPESLRRAALEWLDASLVDEVFEYFEPSLRVVEADARGNPDGRRMLAPT